MFNDDIQAHSLVDVYERLKNYKRSDREHVEVLHSMLNHYWKVAGIRKKINESDHRPTRSLGWQCAELEDSMRESIRLFQQNYGYDPRWVIWKEGKAGLCGFNGNVAIPCMFDEILITFDGKEQLKTPIPVRKEGKCGLVQPDGSATPVTGFEYDLLFREPYAKCVKYIAVRNGRFGIINTEGKEVIPCILDDIFERQDADGFLPLLKDGKWGICTDCETVVLPRFDELAICSEDYLRARIGSRWGWVTKGGNLSNNKHHAAFGSWYDADK